MKWFRSVVSLCRYEHRVVADEDSDKSPTVVRYRGGVEFRIRAIFVRLESLLQLSR
jgi:hypothetical protein